jgi:class 3 adenylate cyclase
MQDIAQKIALNDADVEKAERFRRERKTSVLVIMFTDIEGSTALREKLGDLRFEKILEEHDSMLLPIIAEHGGVHIKSIGDSIMAVFSEPSSAVQCALRIEERLHGHPWLKVRIGMDMGQVSADEAQGIMKDVFGRFVNRAARVESLANGGHILVTEQIQDSASGWIPREQISWFCHGEHTVKGVEKSLKIWEPYNSNTTRPMMTEASINQQPRPPAKQSPTQAWEQQRRIDNLLTQEPAYGRETAILSITLLIFAGSVIFIVPHLPAMRGTPFYYFAVPGIVLASLGIVPYYGLKFIELIYARKKEIEQIRTATLGGPKQSPG